MTALTIALLSVTLTTTNGPIHFLEYEDSKIYWGDPALSIDVVKVDFDVITQQEFTNSFDCVSTNVRACTLISPSIGISCAHYAPPVGSELYFGDEGAVVTSVVIQDGYESAMDENDVSYVYFDRELTVKPAALAPIDFDNWLTGTEYGCRYGTWGYTVGKMTGCQACRFYNGTGPTGGVWMETTYISGDSGAPVFYMINGEPVLVGVAVSSLGGWRMPQDESLERGWFYNY